MLRKLLFWLILIVLIVFVIKASLNHYDKKTTAINNQLIIVPTQVAHHTAIPNQPPKINQPTHANILKTNETKVLSATRMDASTG